MTSPAVTSPSEPWLGSQPPRGAFPRAFWILALVGLLLRLMLLWMPILEDNSQVRQTQTAVAAQAYLVNGWWPPETRANWRGDLDARFLQELPLYNYAAAGLATLTGNLDVAGRLVSALLWLASFFVLQLLWRPFLSEAEAFWANVLFVFAPLSIAYGQAFMPEMAIQLAAFLFLYLGWSYVREPGLGKLTLLGLVGLVGITLKLPEVSHLYVLFFVLLLLKDGWRAFLKPAYWVLLIVTVVVTKLWSGYLDTANSPHFEMWSASGNLQDFLGKYGRLLEPKRYVSVGGYVTAFILTPVGLLLVAWGVIRAWGRGGWRYLPLLWLFSLAFFYLVWGPRTAFTHAYYNLPSLGPLAAMFGIGAVGFLAWTQARAPALRLALRYGALAVFALLAAAGTYYLVRPEWTVFRAAKWVEANTAPDDIVLLKSNHINHLARYPHYAALPYYSGRRAWIWMTDSGAIEAEPQHVLATSDWFVELVPDEEPGLLRRLQTMVKARRDIREDMSWLTTQPGVKPVHAGDGFKVYRLSQPEALTPPPDLARPRPEAANARPKP
ncbi:MAG: glycosyltransferase family 39 protein [Verrucomicrobiota bacterium]